MIAALAQRSDGLVQQPLLSEKEVVRALSALAQTARLQVFRALVVAGHEGMTPGTMAEALGVPSNTLSFHLKELTNAGLVSQDRQGRHLIYRAAYGQMNGLIRYLTENCCQGQRCDDPLDASCTTARRTE